MLKKIIFAILITVGITTPTTGALKISDYKDSKSNETKAVQVSNYLDGAYHAILFADLLATKQILAEASLEGLFYCPPEDYSPDGNQGRIALIDEAIEANKQWPDDMELGLVLVLALSMKFPC